MLRFQEIITFFSQHHAEIEHVGVSDASLRLVLKNGEVKIFEGWDAEDRQAFEQYLKRLDEEPDLDPLTNDLIEQLRYGNFTTSAIDTYIQRGGDVRVLIGNQTLLEFLLENYTIIPPNLEDIIEILVKNGVDVNYTGSGENDETVLEGLLNGFAIPHALRLVQCAGSRLDYTALYANNMTPLIFATFKHEIEIAIKMLQIIGSTPRIVDRQDDYGRTALHYACLYNNQALVAALLEAGASKLIKDKQELTPFDYVGSARETIKSVLFSAKRSPSVDETMQKNFLYERRHIQDLFVLTEADSETTSSEPITVLLTPAEPEPIFAIKAEIDIDRLMSARLAVKCGGRLRELKDEDKQFIRAQYDRMTGVSLMEAIERSAAPLRAYLQENNHMVSVPAQPSGVTELGIYAQSLAIAERAKNANAARPHTPT